MVMGAVLLVWREREFTKSMEKISLIKIQRFMLNENGDWIVWKRNAPLANHMGGV